MRIVAGFTGSLLAVVLAIVIAGAGNLWGLVLIFGAAFSAMIALGVRMVWARRTPNS